MPRSIRQRCDCVFIELERLGEARVADAAVVAFLVAVDEGFPVVGAGGVPGVGVSAFIHTLSAFSAFFCVFKLDIGLEDIEK